MRRVLGLAGLSMLLMPCWASAQWGWGPSYHASTAEEGIQRGAADIVRSQGMRNLLNSEAMKNIEDARAKNIDNRLRWTKTYFEMKRYNKEYREANRRPRPTPEQLFRMAKAGSPKPLSPSQLDPKTGQVNWPPVLLNDEFSQQRQKLEEMLAARARAKGKLSLDQMKQLLDVVNDMQIILKRNIKSYPPQVFSSANAFLRSLAYEIRKAMM